jgi:hypothetical protein
MANLRVSQAEAMRLLQTIPHSKCVQSIPTNWEVESKGHVHYHSVCWLFCWATTGMSSQEAAARSREVFNQILNISYNQFNAAWNNDGYKKAQDGRGYKGWQESQAEADFEQRLGHVPQPHDPLQQFKTATSEALQEFKASIGQAVTKFGDSVKRALEDL